MGNTEERLKTDYAMILEAWKWLKKYGMDSNSDRREKANEAWLELYRKYHAVEDDFAHKLLGAVSYELEEIYETK